MPAVQYYVIQAGNDEASIVDATGGGWFQDSCALIQVATGCVGVLHRQRLQLHGIVLLEFLFVGARELLQHLAPLA